MKHKIKTVLSLCLFSFIFLNCCTINNSNLFFKNLTFKEIRENILYVNVLYSFKLKEKNNEEILGAKEYSISGSASVIKYDSKEFSLILTAEHVCNYKPNEPIFSFYDKNTFELLEEKTIVVRDTKGESYVAYVISYNKKYDVCVLASLKIPREGLKISDDEPNVIDRYFAMGFPNGLWSENFVPIFSGFFIGKINGRIPGTFADAYSIPSSGGISGSPIIDARGKIVGVLHSTFIRFNQMSLGANLKHIKEVLNEALEIADEMKKNMEELSIKTSSTSTSSNR